MQCTSAPTTSMLENSTEKGDQHDMGSEVVRFLAATDDGIEGATRIRHGQIVEVKNFLDSVVQGMREYLAYVLILM